MSDSIAQWLERLGLGRYSDLFAEQQIDYEILPELAEEDFEKLGIPLGPRKKLLKAIAQLKLASASNEVREEPPFWRHPNLPMRGAASRKTLREFLKEVDTTAGRTSPEVHAMIEEIASSL